MQASGGRLHLCRGDSLASLRQLVAQTGAERGVLEPPIRAGRDRARHADEGRAARAGARGAQLRGRTVVRAMADPDRTGRTVPGVHAVLAQASRAAGRLPHRCPPPPLRLADSDGGLPLEALRLLPAIEWTGGLARSLDAGRAWSPRDAGAVRRRCAGRLRPRPRPAGPARYLAAVSAPALRRDLPAPDPAAAWKPPPRRATRAAGRTSNRTCASWAGASSPTICCTTSRTRPRPTSIRASTAFPWAAADPALLRRWQRGRTGIPLVDAGMRELWAHRLDAQPRAHDRGQPADQEPAPALAARRALVLGHAGRRRPGQQHTGLAMGGRLRRRCRAVFPHLQPGHAGAAVRSRRAATCGAGCRSWPTPPRPLLHEPWRGSGAAPAQRLSGTDGRPGRPRASARWPPTRPCAISRGRKLARSTSTRASRRDGGSSASIRAGTCRGPGPRAVRGRPSAPHPIRARRR